MASFSEQLEGFSLKSPLLVGAGLDKELLADQQGVSVELVNVGFSIKGQSILKGVNARFESGKVTALMGPSGAGKTTLLSLLSGHANDWGQVNGSVLVNGTSLSNRMFRRLGTMVPQDDVLLPGLTVRQTLLFGAALKCKGFDAAQRIARVEALLEALGLCTCAAVLVGAANGLRGVSGGQRKRCSIAMELLSDPAILYLDEPTSGLDSKMAEDVATLLTTLARGGKDGATVNRPRTVVCTIHQPSFRIFQSFDEVLFLGREEVGDAGCGRVAFVGSASALLAHLDALAVACPRFENPADHMMRLLQDQDQLRSLVRVHAERDLEAATNCGPKANRSAGLDGDAMDALLAAAVARGGFAVGYLQQFFILFQRFAVDYLRDPQKFLMGIAIRSLIGLILGVVWIGQAGDTQPSIFPVQGALFACCLNGTLDTVYLMALLLPNLKPLLFREYRNGYYGLLPMQLALLACNGIAQNINIATMSVPVYFLVGLTPNFARFAIFVAALSALVWLGVSIGIGIGAFASSFLEAQAAVTPLLVPLILFSGFIIPYQQIPSFFKFLYDLSFFQHAIAILEINYFAGLKFSDCPPTFAPWTDDSPRGKGNWTCAEVFQTAGVAVGTVTGSDNLFASGGVVDNCVKATYACHETGEDFLTSVHVKSDDMGFKFFVIIAYIVGAFALGYVALCRALKTSLYCF